MATVLNTFLLLQNWVTGLAFMSLVVLPQLCALALCSCHGMQSCPSSSLSMSGGMLVEHAFVFLLPLYCS